MHRECVGNVQGRMLRKDEERLGMNAKEEGRCGTYAEGRLHREEC